MKRLDLKFLDLTRKKINSQAYTSRSRQQAKIRQCEFQFSNYLFKTQLCLGERQDLTAWRKLHREKEPY